MRAMAYQNKGSKAHEQMCFTTNGCGVFFKIAGKQLTMITERPNVKDKLGKVWLFIGAITV